jgi:hypothetical protein
MDSTGDTRVASSAEDANVQDLQVHSTNPDPVDAIAEAVEESGEHGFNSGDEDNGESGDESEPSDKDNASDEEEEEDSDMEENAKFNDDKIHFIDLQVKKLEPSESKPTLIVGTSLLTVTVDYYALEDSYALSHLEGLELIRQVLPDGESFAGLQGKLAYLLRIPEEREIRVVWSASHNEWIYNSNDREIDLAPFLITQMSKEDKQLAAYTFKPAPIFGIELGYPCFNYALDTLYLYYGYCGEQSYDMQQYSVAIHNAIHHIALVQKENPTAPQVKFVKATWCPSLAPTTIYNFAHKFTAIRGIQKLTLQVHSHFIGMDASKAQNCINKDDAQLNEDADSGVLSPGAFPFEVEIQSAFGTTVP